MAAGQDTAGVVLRNERWSHATDLRHRPAGCSKGMAYNVVQASMRHHKAHIRRTGSGGMGRCKAVPTAQAVHVLGRRGSYPIGV